MFPNALVVIVCIFGGYVGAVEECPSGQCEPLPVGLLQKAQDRSSQVDTGLIEEVEADAEEAEDREALDQEADDQDADGQEGEDPESLDLEAEDQEAADQEALVQESEGQEAYSTVCLKPPGKPGKFNVEICYKNIGKYQGTKPGVVEVGKVSSFSVRDSVPAHRKWFSVGITSTTGSLTSCAYRIRDVLKWIQSDGNKFLKDKKAPVRFASKSFTKGYSKTGLCAAGAVDNKGYSNSLPLAGVIAVGIYRWAGTSNWSKNSAALLTFSCGYSGANADYTGSAKTKIESIKKKMGWKMKSFHWGDCDHNSYRKHQKEIDKETEAFIVKHSR